MGADVRTSTRVTALRPRAGSISITAVLDAGTTIWAAVASRLAGSPVAGRQRHDRAGRVIVGPRSSIAWKAQRVRDRRSRHRCATTRRNNVPGVAPAANQMGRYVGRSDLAGAGGGECLPAFRYRHPGESRHHRPAGRGREARPACTSKASSGWLFWSVAHIYFRSGCSHRFIVAFTLVVGLPHSRAAAARCGSARRNPPVRAGLDTEQRHHTPAEPIISLLLPVAADCSC